MRSSNLARQTECFYQEAEWKVEDARKKYEERKKWKSDFRSNWQVKASETIQAMGPQYLTHTKKKLVHLKDIRNYENQLITLLQKNKKTKTSWDKNIMMEADSLHDNVTNSIKAIYSSSYNHRGDKLEDLYTILFTIEHDLPCHNELTFKNEVGLNYTVLSYARGMTPKPRGDSWNPRAPKRRVGIIMKR